MASFNAHIFDGLSKFKSQIMKTKLQTTIFGTLTKQTFICYFLDKFSLMMDNCNDLISCFQNCWIFSFLYKRIFLHIDRIQILLCFTLRVVNKQRRYVAHLLVHRVHMECHISNVEFCLYCIFFHLFPPTKVKVHTNSKRILKKSQANDFEEAKKFVFKLKPICLTL